MSIGLLRARIALDKPYKTYYGSKEPITGEIHLMYSSDPKNKGETGSELFGPLKVTVIFHGRAKTKIQERDYIYRASAPLFSRRQVIYDDAFRSQPQEQRSIPFMLNFPESAESVGPKAIQHIQANVWEEDSRFAYSVGDPLPPSFRCEYYGLTNQFDSFVEYRVGIEVEVPRLQVSIYKPEKDHEPVVLYERPRLSQRIGDQLQKRSGNVSVSNELLLPEEDRPSGFRAKMKAKLRHDTYPTYSFDWACLIPRHLYIGQPCAFELHIRPREEACTAGVIPEVTVSDFAVQLVRQTTVRGGKGLLTSPEAGCSDDLTLRHYMNDERPFSKANDWSKTVNTQEIGVGRQFPRHGRRPVPYTCDDAKPSNGIKSGYPHTYATTGSITTWQPKENLASTFQVYNVSQKYTLKWKLGFSAAGQTEKYEGVSLVTLHPPLQEPGSGATESSASVGGPSNRPLDLGDVEEALPQYEHVPEYAGATTGGDAMPQDDKVS